jgi:oleate hydratase
MAKAFVVGSGIAGLAAAAYLIREGGFLGPDITILEEMDIAGGSLDAGGDTETGYTMRGSRMFEAHFQCTYDLLKAIPALNDPSVSVTEDIFTFHQDYPWEDHARLISGGQIVQDFHEMGFTEHDRLELIKCSSTPEHLLDGKRVSDCFSEHFFTTNFWYMWCTTFAFEPWHSAIEFRRYLNRFVHLFKQFDTMAGIYKTRYNQYDSIARPLARWLTAQGVTIRFGTEVEDLALADDKHKLTVRAITWTAGGKHETVKVGPEDLVFVTNGSMTANTTRGYTDKPAVLDRSGSSGSWRLWHTLARKRSGLGNPAVFDASIADSTFESFTVTTKDPTFYEIVEKLTERPAGTGGIFTFKDSNWLLTLGVTHQPQYFQQPQGSWVWWAYALFPDKPGNYVTKPMSECTGREMADELMRHMRIEDEIRTRILDDSIVIPALMPYITSQFLVRRSGDRPQVVPKGSVNLAFIGQYAEVPDDCVFTVEYSVRTAWAAVAGLLKLKNQPPPVYKGKHNPKVLIEALETMHQRAPKTGPVKLPPPRPAGWTISPSEHART